MTIAAETRLIVEAALAGDPALASLAIAGADPDTLAAHIALGVPAKSIGGSSYSPAPPFRRETLVELLIRMQRLRWQRAAGGFIAGLCAVGRNRDDGRMTSTSFLRKILIFAEELAQ